MSECHVTWLEIERVLTYCDRLRERLGLSHWGVGVSERPASEDAHAEVSHNAGKRFASLFLAASWEEKPTRLKRTILLHEMLHLAHAEQQYAISDLVSGSTEISTDRSDLIMKAYTTASEYMVDALTAGLMGVRGFLPAWPTDEEAKAAKHSNMDR